MRIHLLAPPNAPTTAEYALDGFAQLTRRAARLFVDLGHDVILYGAEETDAPCQAFVSVLTAAERQRLLAGTPYQRVVQRPEHPLWMTANVRMIDAIADRKRERDAIVLLGGVAQAPVLQAHPDLLDCEYSIGYTASVARYRVFQSSAHMHTTYGIQGLGFGRWFDTVIPAWFDDQAYPLVPEAADPPYVCYVGRLEPNKGIDVACRAAKLAGVALKVVGHGDPTLVTYGDYLGALEQPPTAKIMGRATALLAPTLYLEPFGSVVAEAALCGTPAITSDFGAFRETVEEGVTGFRCHYLGEFARAIERAASLDRRAIGAWARAHYTAAAVGPQYAAYFQRLELMWQDGWEHGLGPLAASRANVRARRPKRRQR